MFRNTVLCLIFHLVCVGLPILAHETLPSSEETQTKNPFLSLLSENGAVCTDALIKKLSDLVQSADTDHDGTLSAQEQQASAFLSFLFDWNDEKSADSNDPSVWIEPARTHKGDILLDKLLKKTPKNIRESLDRADLNHNGIVTAKEQKKINIKIPTPNQP